jgi:hypothetical protein
LSRPGMATAVIPSPDLDDETTQRTGSNPVCWFGDFSRVAG